LDIFVQCRFFIPGCSFIARFEARRSSRRGSFQRHRLNTNNGRRRRLLFDLDVCWLRDAQSLPYRAGARVALAGDDVALHFLYLRSIIVGLPFRLLVSLLETLLLETLSLTLAVASIIVMRLRSTALSS
jgi:hypothetical protein